MPSSEGEELKDKEKFLVRFPSGMRSQISEISKRNHRSMNSEIISRLDKSLKQETSFENQMDNSIDTDETKLLDLYRKDPNNFLTTIIQYIDSRLDLGDTVIPAVIDGISNTRGDDFFNAITRQLCIALRADYTFIGRLNDDHTKARTVALCKNGKLIENFDYELKHTPCELVSHDNICVYTKGVRQKFPNDQLLVDMDIDGYLGTPLHSSEGEVIGVIVALYEQPISNAERVSSIFQLFSGRIAAEIENTALKNISKNTMDMEVS